MSRKRFDGVLTYHSNIHTCGVARFNHLLAKHLEAPLLKVTLPEHKGLRNPIVSIKFSEVLESHRELISRTIRSLESFSAILHDFEISPLASLIVERADRLMGLNKEITDMIRTKRLDAVTGFTVASYHPPTSQLRPDIRLVTFGMAHKIQSAGYQKVAELLKRDTRSHLLEISSALHEGTEFNDSFFEVGDEISSCFEGRVRFLGFLADDEVSLKVSQATAILAFFPKGTRENNNSVMSAMRLAVPVITNLDDYSPSWLRHDDTVFDVNKLSVFPSKERLRAVGIAGQTATARLSYASLLEILANDE